MISQQEPWISVRGARENNLKNVDVDLPRNALVAFTGVSGSGKSSLAFSTIYAEAERRYLETVAPYARRLIRQVGVADVDSITGLPPAVALAQNKNTFNSRSTVGTLTTLSNLMRLLYSRAGSYPPGVRERLDADAFSPNTPNGACPICEGSGKSITVNEDALVPDTNLSIRQGAIAAWPGAWQGKNLRDIVIALGIDVDKPFRKLARAQQKWLLLTDEQPVVLVEPGDDRNEYPYNGKFVSARRHVLHSLMHSPSERQRARAAQFVVAVPCSTCQGSRLAPRALAVRFQGHSIAQLGGLPLEELITILSPIAQLKAPRAATPSVRSGEKTVVAVSLTRTLCARINALKQLGLGHLSLDRPMPSLSSGEIQRLRLATAVHAGLFGVVYILDEPSAGLHPADAAPLFELFSELKKAGNSLLVVEHDMNFVRRADWVVEVGPWAGEHGGEVLYSGPVDGLRRVPNSLTRQYLFDSPRGSKSWPRRSIESQSFLSLSGVNFRNLQDLSIRFPLGRFTAVCGVSGSGKSTLVSQLLVRSLLKNMGRSALDEVDEGPLDAALLEAAQRIQVNGAHGLSKVVLLDQRPIGRTPRSNLATYTGLFDHVRRLFAQSPGAKKLGFSASRFSFNLAEGRCEECQGVGFVSVELIFLQSSYAVCPACHGARYNEQTLRVRLGRKTIADVLNMTVDEAAAFFSAPEPLTHALATLKEVGLGYLRLGQPAPELSGGEAQRIRLATELQRGGRAQVLYVLDEPSASLHPHDTARLVAKLHELVDRDNTVIVVEHNLAVLASADWIIELGPGGGAHGGRIVAQGSPEKVARVKRSATAPYLAHALRGEH